MKKSMFPSLIKSLVKPNTKKIINGIHLIMSTDMHSEGSESLEMMGLNDVEVQFILESMNTLESIIFFPSGSINWVDAGHSLQKIFPKNLDDAPTFKQVFSYLNEAIDSFNTEAVKSITKEFAETLYMMDFDDKNTYYLLPEEIISVDIPSGHRKKLYF